MEVLGDIHIIQSNECVKILFFDLHVPQLPYFHHQLHFLLVSKGLIHQDVLDVLLLRVDLKVVLVVGGRAIIRSLLLNHILLSLHNLLILKLLLRALNIIHSDVGLLELPIGSVRYLLVRFLARGFFALMVWLHFAHCVGLYRLKVWHRHWLIFRPLKFVSETRFAKFPFVARAKKRLTVSLNILEISLLQVPLVGWVSNRVNIAF